MPMIRNSINRLLRGLAPRKEQSASDEALEMSQLKRLLQKDDPVILEIGANGGEDSVRMLEAFPSARFFAFEPDTRAIERWKENVGNRKAQLFEVALGRSNTTASFFPSEGSMGNMPEGWDLSGSLREPTGHLEKHPGVTFLDPVEVQVLTLDSWAETHGIDEIDFIWADVQGAESDLIAGGTKALNRCRYFYTEFDNDALYSGQWGLNEIASSLPNHKIHTRWKGDVLFEHTSMLS